MIEWLKTIRRKIHIKKEQCFVFRIIPKEELIDGTIYETFVFKKDKVGTWSIDTRSEVWSSEKDCFIGWGKFYSYEEFKPIKRKEFSATEEYSYTTLSYNPCDVNALDLEELKKITFDLNDDNTESDDVWERLIKYFEERGF